MSDLLAGTIAAPPTPEGVMVKLPQRDGGTHRHGPCRWAPRGDGIEPRRGDPCVVVEDDSGGMFVLWDGPPGALLVHDDDPRLGRYTPDWQTPTFGAGYQDRGTTTPSSACRYDLAPNGRLEMRGWVERPSRAWVIDDTLVTLPRGVIGVSDVPVTVVANNVRGRGSVDVNGRNVRLRSVDPGLTWGGTVNLISMRPVQFWAET